VTNEGLKKTKKDNKIRETKKKRLNKTSDAGLFKKELIKGLNKKYYKNGKGLMKGLIKGLNKTH
jgi:hypothetical protein